MTSQGLPTEGVPARWPERLPLPLSGFIGRRQERADVAELVATNRLVTLVGAGGVGKTRLAVEVAAGAAAGFDDGVDLVDLAPVREAASLPATLARSLDLEEWGDTTIEDRLVARLRAQRRLVVLDNCEHLKVGCAALVSFLLSRCGSVAVLITSRESLGVPGEITWRVPSLSFPWPDRPTNVEDIQDYEAVALFLDRARSARPGFVMTPDDVAPVTQICYRLDGIPLALELAAARMSALSLPEIAQRISGRFDLLAAGGSGPARHQTLQASVEWSYQLLDDVEQALFRRVAVFAGGWSLDAAEAVVGSPPIADTQVAGVIAQLVDKSLVDVDQSGPDSRYRLLETIRVFAGQRLVDSGEHDQFSRRHAEHFAQLAAGSGPRLRGPDQAGWARLLEREDANIRAARVWCDQHPSRAGLGLAMSAGLWEFWHIRGRLTEAVDWLSDALDRARETTAARAEALNGLGVITAVSGNHPRATRLFEESVQAYEHVENLQGLARAWTHLGNARIIEGDVIGAEEAFARGLEVAQRCGSRWHQGFAQYLWGFGASVLGDLERAVRLLESSVAVFEEAGDLRGVAYGLTVLGDCFVQQAAPDEAVESLTEAIRGFQTLPDNWGLLYASNLLAAAEAARGHWERCALLVGLTEGLCERTGAELFPYQQQGAVVVAAACEKELGTARFTQGRNTGRAAGRGGDIAEALWPIPYPTVTAGDTGNTGASPRLLALSRRELEVAELIAQGLTNRHIAQQLFIAERTVDTHVGHILTKLHCTTRAQVAALVARHSTSELL